MLSAWFRVIRIRFLLSSVIAVSVGLAISWWHIGQIDILYAIMTMGGVVSLHASVDLLNDYWDFKRGIDTQTQRTKMSGGTGVLPEGLLQPNQVYRAGLGFLIIGALIGSYFVIIDGIVIGMILAFAVVSIYFVLISGIFYEIFPIYCIISIVMFPLIIKAGLLLKQNFDNINKLIPAMSYTITFSRITGALFVIGFLLNL